MSEPLRVVHFGVVGNAPSGMAQVVNEYMSWSIPGVRQTAIATTRSKRDPLSPLLLLRAVLLLLTRRVLRRVDTVAVHLSESGSFIREGLIVMLADALGLRVVAHLHGATFESFAARQSGLVAVVLRRADAIAALTFQTEKITALLAPSTPLTLIPNAVKVPSVINDERTKTVLFAGEVGERKGVDVLLAAWRRLGADRFGWELHIAGPDKTQLLELNGSIPGLIYHGALPHSEVLQLAETTRVAVLPSRREALPMFLLESMARGNMPIGTPVGQVAQLVDGVGLLVEPGDAVALTDALRQVCSGDLDIVALARNARTRVEERYSPDRVRDLLVALWDGCPERGDRAS